MRFKLSQLSSLLFLFSLSALPAQDVVLGPGEAGGLPPLEASVQTGPETLAGPGAEERFVVIEDLWLVPWFEVDRSSAGGLTTLLAVRNPFDRDAEVDLSYRSVSGAVLAVDSFRLDPNATRTINLRDVAGLSADADGIARGYVVIESDRDTSVDYFFVTPEEDFATGGRVTADVCRIWGLRYLSGGGFSGGTEIQLYVANPLGANPGTDPPSARIQAHTESGESLGSVNVWTADQALELTAEEILDAFPGPTPSAGALEIRFTEDAERGYVQGTYSAENQFSIGLSGSCLQSF